MSIQGIPLTRSVFVAPFANVLEELGAPTTSLLARFHLPTHLKESPDQYVPLLPALRMVTTAQQSQGLSDFGFLAVQRLGFEALSESFKNRVHRSPTLLAALESWCRYVQMEDNVLVCWLAYHRDSLRVCYANTFANASDMPNREHAQWIQNMMTIYIVRQFAGDDWVPATFAFESRYRPGTKTLERWPRTLFVAGEAATWIDIPISDLSLSLRSTNMTPRPSTGRPLPINADLISTLKLMLSGFLDENMPSITEAAEIIGTSVRTLQRELAEGDFTYPRLVNQIRFEKAADLLRNTDGKIIDIAQAVGFENPSHLDRIFRRIAGVTPCQYRKNHGSD